MRRAARNRAQAGLAGESYAALGCACRDWKSRCQNGLFAVEPSMIIKSYFWRYFLPSMIVKPLLERWRKPAAPAAMEKPKSTSTLKVCRYFSTSRPNVSYIEARCPGLSLIMEAK